MYDAIVKTITSAFPDTQAIYRFGTWGTSFQRPDSDLDIAVLLPHNVAKSVDFMDWVSLNGELAYVSHTDRVDLVNLRTAPTDMKAEIISAGEVVFCPDDDVRIAYEALVLKTHQELNRRREPLYQDMMADAKAPQP